MRVAALADLHGRLDGVVVPPCDLVVIAGDLSPFAWKEAPSQVPWLEAVFAPWLERIAAEAGAPVAGIAGNRDFALWWDRRTLEKLPWTYLCDSEASIAGARLYGSPWCPRRRVSRRPTSRSRRRPAPGGREGAALAAARARGVFMASGEDELAERFAAIPDGLDILVTHTPPAGHGDRTQAGEHVGSARAARRDRARQPPLALFGHIHEGRARADPRGANAVRELGDLRPLVRAPQPARLFDLDVSAGTVGSCRDA